jgi:hypothetical protein
MVWLDAAQMQKRAWADAHQPWLRSEGAKMKARWRTLGYDDVSYVLTQETGGLVPDDPCSSAPTRLRFHADTLISARFEISAGPKCQRGAAVDSKHLGHRLLSPNDLFDLVEAAAFDDPTNVSGCKAADVQFDDATGLPVSLTGACTWWSDSGWSVKVTEIEVH